MEYKKDRLTVKIQMEPLLKAFILSAYNREQQILFPKKDKLNHILKLLLKKTPPGHHPKSTKDGFLEIIIPYYEDLNILSYNYMPPNDQIIFGQFVKMKFWSTFEDFMDDCYIKGIKQKDSIHLFMEKYNISVDLNIEERLKKELYRSKKIFRKYPKRAYCRKNPLKH